VDERSGRDAGALVRASRQKAGLTQQQLAKAAGVSVGVVRDLEQGRTTRPRGESVRRLANALRLSQQKARQLSLAARGSDFVGDGVAAGGHADELRIGVLGPLAAWRRSAPVALGPPMQRGLLGLLALSAGTGLSRSAIIDTLWRGDPPMTAASMLQSYISRLRRLLGPGRIVLTVGSAYLLQPAACELDLREFDALVRRARKARAAGDLTAACHAYADALALWRGDPLADCDILWGHPAVVRLSQQKADAVTGYADAAIAAHRPERVIPPLRELTDSEPLNERAHALLMIALAGSGQQATALSIFDQIRRRLDYELGIRPGAQLIAAQAQVLSQQIPVDPVSCQLPAPASANAVGSQLAGSPAPRQLPSAVAHFVGRAAELTALNTALSQPAGKTIVISAIAGTAGVGKTALAIHWGHQVSEWFPDGQLYVNLRGYDPEQPIAAADALATLLRALSVPGREIPPEEDERAARYRSLLAGKRMLIVLDNAASADQVRPLLPGTPACTVIVTSRDALAGLVARDGATRLDLDLLPQEDAVGLLRTLIGARVDAAPDEAAELADQCCRLPLALRVAAEIATSHPGVPLAELTGELADLHKRLDLLVAGGDRRTAVRAVFSWSYHHLAADAAQTFRLLGLHPGPDFESYAVAALTGMTVEQARQMLDVLARAHLIHASSPGRYGLHDLLRAYARELSGVRDGTERHEALTRLFDHYQGTAAAAMDALHPAERHWRPRIPPPSTPAPPVCSPAGAQGWLDAERATLVAITVQAAEHGWHAYTSQLAAILGRYLSYGSHYPEAIIIHSRAQVAARQAGDTAGEAAALNALGLVAFHRGRYQQATDHLQQALALFRVIGDRIGQARALNNLGVVSFLQGHYAQAYEWWQQSKAVHREEGDQAGEASLLGNLGLLDLRQGRYEQASGRLQQSLALARMIGKRTTEFTALVNLGDVSLRQGAYQLATAQLQQALALARELSDRNHEASALVRLGEVSLRLGRYEQAADHLQQALALARETGDREDEAEALNGLGEVLLGNGQPARARVRHAAALELASQIGGKYQQARAHDGLARAHQAAGAPGQARPHWRQALRLYADLGAPEADDIRALLIAVGEEPCPELSTTNGDFRCAQQDGDTVA
jgi:DNA-binding SARP family transcriptional activator/tetratricopeptide (TPR) repeat protein/DNA-binding XRE family transcriptional regulator